MRALRVIGIFCWIGAVSAFAPPRSGSPVAAAAVCTSTCTSSALTETRNGSVEIPDGQERMSQEAEATVQWDLFKKHHALGSWRGTWTTYNYMGDVIDSTVASVDLDLDASGSTCSHIHKIVAGSVKADCETCFDSEEVKSMPVSQYSLGNLGRNRLGSAGMVTGPSILRSGAMSTELILRHGDGRVRVIFQHAPVWEAGVEPGSCPPQGLKLFRAMVSREALRAGPPTAVAEELHPPKAGNPKFFRGVPPFHWHKRWAGTSWTWGPTTGDRGWQIQEMEEGDAWHGRPMGDGTDVWSMRLPGGILVQCPRVIVSGQAGICRLAWLPEADDDNASLLRIEASVLALEPILDEKNEEMMVGFYPPTLGSLRCDMMKKLGELEDASTLKRLMEIDANSEQSGDGEGSFRPLDETEIPPPSQLASQPQSKAAAATVIRSGSLDSKSQQHSVKSKRPKEKNDSPKTAATTSRIGSDGGDVDDVLKNLF